VKKLTALSTNR